MCRNFLFPRWSRLAAAAPQETALRITAQAVAESQEEQTTKQSIEAYFPEGTLRYHSRFFVQVGHETSYVSSGFGL